MGRESLVDFATETPGLVLTAAVPGVFLPKPGAVLWLMIRRDPCFVIPAS
jgi:iron(III) transport system ATP-binding protein